MRPVKHLCTWCPLQPCSPHLLQGILWVNSRKTRIHHRMLSGPPPHPGRNSSRRAAGPKRLRMALQETRGSAALGQPQSLCPYPIPSARLLPPPMLGRVTLGTRTPMLTIAVCLRPPCPRAVHGDMPHPRELHQRQAGSKHLHLHSQHLCLPQSNITGGTSSHNSIVRSCNIQQLGTPH
jgi:hypothetical protein